MTNVRTGREVGPKGSAHLEPKRPGPTVAQILRDAARDLSNDGVESARLDAEWLLMSALGWAREKLYRNLRCGLDDERLEVFVNLMARRRRGEPAAYITGQREFWSLDFKVGRDVLIPRPDTEHLVETGLRFLDSCSGTVRVLELGTGSGAVAVSLACARPDIEVWATDISMAALRVARSNAVQHGVAQRIRFCQTDLLGGLDCAHAPFAAILSNPPYICSGDLAHLPGGVRDWEPRLALDGGPDGMDFHRRIIAQGARHLSPGGLLALEIGAEMAESVCCLFGSGREFTAANVVRDYAGCDRIVWALREDEVKRVDHGG